MRQKNILVLGFFGGKGGESTIVLMSEQLSGTDSIDAYTLRGFFILALSLFGQSIL